MGTTRTSDGMVIRRGPAPSTRLHKAVFTACGQRAEHASNLWLVYSARHDRDWALTSDVEYLHFLILDFDPKAIGFDLRPAPDIVRLREEDRKTIFDAIVRFRDGHTEFRELKRVAEPPPEPEENLRTALQEEAQYEAAKRHGGKYVNLVLKDFEPLHLRIQNSMRMLRFLCAARGEPLGEISRISALNRTSKRRPNSARCVGNESAKPRYRSFRGRKCWRRCGRCDPHGGGSHDFP